MLVKDAVEVIVNAEDMEIVLDDVLVGEDDIVDDGVVEADAYTGA